jgi:hypothetical protein
VGRERLAVGMPSGEAARERADDGDHGLDIVRRGLGVGDTHLDRAEAGMQPALPPGLRVVSE